ncbi:MAG: iron ABC transporter permease [Pseudomonadota bacterium]
MSADPSAQVGADPVNGRASRSLDVSHQSFKQRLIIPAAALACLVLAFASLFIGPTGISVVAIPAAVSALVWGDQSATALQAKLVLVDLRLPRTLLAAFVGAALALSGAMMQGMFRNPLADPGLIGVSAGATLAAIATIALGDSLLFYWSALLGPYALSASAFLGGFVAVLMLMFVAGRGGQIMTSTLLLAGIAFSALALALAGLIAYGSDDRELRDLTLWQMGSLTGSSWEKFLAAVPFALVIFLSIPLLTRALNGLLLGEAAAFHLGINVPRAKLAIVLITAASVGAAVAAAGMIGFVGIVVPHVVRLMVGPDHRVLLPASALLGAALVLFADILARMVVAPSELPIGIIMAIIGAPVFLHLVLSRGRG